MDLWEEEAESEERESEREEQKTNNTCTFLNRGILLKVAQKVAMNVSLVVHFGGAT